MRLPRYTLFTMTERAGLARALRLRFVRNDREGGIANKKEQTEVCSLFVYKKVAFFC